MVDNAANRLQSWCAGLMNRGECTTLVKTTLSAIPVHALTSLDVSSQTLVAFRKIVRGFLWMGRRGEGWPLLGRVGGVIAEILRRPRHSQPVFDKLHTEVSLGLAP